MVTARLTLIESASLSSPVLCALNTENTSYPPATPIVCIRALMVDMEAQMSDSRNSETNRSPSVMLLNTSTMYVGMMKSTPFVTYWKALIPCSSKKYRLHRVPQVYADPTMTKMKMLPMTIERVSVLSSLADMYLTTS